MFKSYFPFPFIFVYSILQQGHGVGSCVPDVDRDMGSGHGVGSCVPEGHGVGSCVP